MTQAKIAQTRLFSFHGIKKLKSKRDFTDLPAVAQGVSGQPRHQPESFKSRSPVLYISPSKSKLYSLMSVRNIF